MPVHRLQARTRLVSPGHQRQVVTHLLEDIGIGAFQRTDALTQAGGKVQLAAHRAFGHFRHLLTDARQFGNLVDAFNFNRGGVHIHHQQARGAQVGHLPERRDVQLKGSPPPAFLRIRRQ
jgi:hypothetical protein